MSKLLSNIAVNDTVLTAVTEYIKGTRNADRTIERERGALLTILMNNGVLPTDLISPNKGGTAPKEDYDAIRSHIVAGFHDQAQNLLTMPSKKVPDGIEGIDWDWVTKTHNGEDRLAKKFKPRPVGRKGKGTAPDCEDARFAVTRGNRNYWQAQIGSKMNDIKNGLDGRYERQHQEEIAKEGKGKGKDEPKVAKVDVNAADIKYFRNVAETGIKRIQKNEAPAYKVAKVQKALNDLLAAMVEAEQA